MIECHRAIHPEFVGAGGQAGVVIKEHDVDGVDESTGEAICGVDYTGRAVYAARLTSVRGSIHCVLPVRTGVHAVSRPKGEIVVYTRAIVRLAGVALDSRWPKTS